MFGTLNNPCKITLQVRLATLVVACFVTVLSQIFYLEQPRVHSAPVMNEGFFQEKEVKNIWLELKAEKKRDSQLSIELITHNDSDAPVYVMTHSSTIKGRLTPYLNLTNEDGSTLAVSVMLYPPPLANYPTNSTGVMLVTLPEKQQHIEKVVLSFPTQETNPPFRDSENKVIELTKVMQIQAFVGVVPVNRSLAKLLARKPKGPYVMGHEMVEVEGKKEHLLGVQKVLSSNTVRF